MDTPSDPLDEFDPATTELDAAAAELLSLSPDELAARIAVREAAFAADRPARVDELRRQGARIADGTAAAAERKELLRRLHRAGWTQKELAESLGTSQQSVSKLITSAGANPLDDEVQDQWFLIGRVFGIASIVASSIGLRGDKERAEALHRLRDKHFTRPVNDVIVDQLLRRVRAEVKAMPAGEFTRAVRAAIADVEQHMVPLARMVIYPRMADVEQCIGGEIRQSGRLRPLLESAQI